MKKNENNRPPRTAAMNTLKAEISELNDFYWSTIVGHRAIREVADSGSDLFLKITDGVDRWKINPKEVPQRLENLGARLIFTCIVSAVSAYEDYLSKIIRLSLLKLALPNNKLKIQIDLSGIPDNESATSYIKKLWVEYKADDLLSKGYSQRHAAIDNAIKIKAINNKYGINICLDDLAIALESRNCIIHCNGVVDQRTFESIGNTIDGVELGKQLPLTESHLHRALSAMLNHAEAIDLCVRLRHRTLAGK